MTFYRSTGLLGPGFSYAEDRALRMLLAQNDQTLDRRCLGRVLLFPMMWRGKKIVGLVEHDVLLDNLFSAREKRQNRKHFDGR